MTLSKSVDLSTIDKIQDHAEIIINKDSTLKTITLTENKRPMHLFVYTFNSSDNNDFNIVSHFS